MASNFKYIRNNKGITLIELIVSLGLITVIIALAFSSYILGTRTFASGNDIYNVQYDARSAAGFISNELRNATEVRFDPPGEPGTYNIIYAAADKKIKYKPVGQLETDVTAALLEDSSALSFKVNTLNGKNVLTFSLNEVSGSKSFKIETAVMLNNITALMDTEGNTYNKIYYLKPSDSYTAERP